MFRAFSVSDKLRKFLVIQRIFWSSNHPTESSQNRRHRPNGRLILNPPIESPLPLLLLSLFPFDEKKPRKMVSSKVKRNPNIFPPLKPLHHRHSHHFLCDLGQSSHGHSNSNPGRSQALQEQYKTCSSSPFSYFLPRAFSQQSFYH